MTTFGPMIGAAVTPAGAIGGTFAIDLTPVVLALADIAVACVATAVARRRRRVSSPSPRTARSAPAPLAA